MKMLVLFVAQTTKFMLFNMFSYIQRRCILYNRPDDDQTISQGKTYEFRIE